MRTIALLLFAAGVGTAAEPRFQVENKTAPRTPFVVVNKTVYIPPACAQCNTGNNQCACPLSYGTCRCGEIKPAEAVPAARPFPVGYPGFRHPDLATTQPTDVRSVAGPSMSSAAPAPARARTFTLAPLGTRGFTSGCASG